MTTLDAIEARLDRIARAQERLVEQLATAALPLTMSKVRAARELDVSVSTLTRLINEGTIKLTKHKKVPSSELLRYAAVEGRAAAPTKQQKHDARAIAVEGRAWLKSRRAH